MTESLQTTEAVVDPPREPRAGALEALKNKIFANYVSTVSLSLMGMWVRVTAMGFLVFEITGDPLKLAMIGVATGVPQLILAPVAGAYLDRVDRRKVLIVVQSAILANMVLLTWLAITGHVTYFWLLLISVIIGACGSFDWPARLSLLPLLVTRRELPSAVAINAAAFDGARVIGPAIAGWVIALLGMSASFALSGAAVVPFLVVLVSMAAMVPTAPAKDIVRNSAFSDLIDGYKYIWRHVEIRTMIFIDLFPIIIGMSYSAMTPAIAGVGGLNVGPQGLGMLMTAAGAGSLIGTLSVTKMNNWNHRGRIVLIGIALFAVAIMAYGLSNTYTLSLFFIAFVGLGYGTAATMNDTLMQLNVDEAYRGRVMAVYSTIWGLSPAGGLLAGAMAKVVGLQMAVALNGLIVLLMVIYLAIWSPMRHID